MSTMPLPAKTMTDGVRLQVINIANNNDMPPGCKARVTVCVYWVHCQKSLFLQITKEFVYLWVSDLSNS